MNANLLLTVTIAAFAASFTAVAADTPAKDAAAVPAQQAPKAEPAKKKVKRHRHMEERGGAAPAEPGEAKPQPKRPPHDHTKER